MRFRILAGTLAALFVVVLALPGPLQAAGQAFVIHQNLSEMVAEADRIYRGTVASTVVEVVEINGSTLATTKFQIHVTELFKGAVEEQNADKQVAVLQVAGTNKPYVRVQGDFAQLSLLPEPPRLEVGGEYLFFTNAPNAYGLSNTIGLGQGYFGIDTSTDTEPAANQLQNLGLFKDMGIDMPAKGAVAYAELADLIRAEIAGGQQ